MITSILMRRMMAKRATLISKLRRRLQGSMRRSYTNTFRNKSRRTISCSLWREPRRWPGAASLTTSSKCSSSTGSRSSRILMSLLTKVSERQSRSSQTGQHSPSYTLKASLSEVAILSRRCTLMEVSRNFWLEKISLKSSDQLVFNSYFI